MTGTRRLATAAATLILLGGLAAPAAAQTLCSAPIAPFCVEVESTFVDDATVERCRQDLTAFAEQVEDYAACLETQVEELRDQQKELEASFNCRAEGGENCPDSGL